MSKEDQAHIEQEQDRIAEQLRLAAIGRRVEAEQKAAAEERDRAARESAEAERITAAVRAALKAESSEARAKVRRTLKNAAGAAVAAAVIVGYGVLVGEAWADLEEP